MNNIEIKLDTVIKKKNQQEWTTESKATCEEFKLEFRGNGFIINQLLKAIPTNPSHLSRVVEIKRADIPVFELMSLKRWLFPVNKQPEQLKRKNWKRKE
jgi:hypothetical protein